MPDEIIEWWTGICPPILPRGSHVELVLKQIVSIFEEVQNILLFYTHSEYFLNIKEIIFVIAILVLGVSEWGYRTTPHT